MWLCCFVLGAFGFLLGLFLFCLVFIWLGWLVSLGRVFPFEDDKNFQVRWSEAGPLSDPLVSLHFVDFNGEPQRLLFEPYEVRLVVEALDLALVRCDDGGVVDATCC